MSIFPGRGKRSIAERLSRPPGLLDSFFANFNFEGFHQRNHGKTITGLRGPTHEVKDGQEEGREAGIKAQNDEKEQSLVQRIKLVQAKSGI